MRSSLMDFQIEGVKYVISLTLSAKDNVSNFQHLEMPVVFWSFSKSCGLCLDLPCQEVAVS